MKSQIGSIYTNIQMHIYKYEAIHESYFMIAEMWKKHPKKHIYTKQQNQNQPEEIKYFLTKNKQMKKERRQGGDLSQRVAVLHEK